jgi:hypothetical protein
MKAIAEAETKRRLTEGSESVRKGQFEGTEEGRSDVTGTLGGVGHRNFFCEAVVNVL